jgi:hypothetical protein
MIGPVSKAWRPFLPRQLAPSFIKERHGEGHCVVVHPVKAYAQFSPLYRKIGRDLVRIGRYGGNSAPEPSPGHRGFRRQEVVNDPRVKRHRG